MTLLDEISEDITIDYSEHPDLQYPIDYRLRQLSYSSRNVLHECPRKFQLQKGTIRDRSKTESVTFAFGHAFGAGVQAVIQGKSWDYVVLDMLLAWDFSDLYGEEQHNNKSFFTAIYAVECFKTIHKSILGDYELAYFKDKPAVELSFKIALPNGFNYRGHVDVVLKNKITGKYLVLELKSTGYKYVQEASYKNSSQALGYSIILDAIVPDASDYEVMYLVYMSTTMEFAAPMLFKKSYSSRAMWIKELLMDVDRIQYYEQEQVYPSYGESCISFGRECEYFSNCTMSTELLTVPFDPATMLDNTEYTLNLTLLDLIDSQLTKDTNNGTSI